MIAESTMSLRAPSGNQAPFAIASARTPGGPTQSVGGAEPRAERL
jgi:hypothetical protein